MSVDELTHVMEHEEPGRPRRALVVLLTLGLIGALIAVFLVMQGDTDALAQLRVRDDRVSVKPTEADFEQGIEGQALVAGDTVRTDGDGQAQVDYFDGSETRMDSDTTLVIGALLNETGRRRVSINQGDGRLWHRVERLTSSEDRYEVRTPNAIASVRGTTFATVGTYAPRWFYLGFEGETIVQILKTGEQFSLLEDDCVTISVNGNARKCTPAELAKLMDDWMLEQLAYQGGELKATPKPSPSASPSASPVLRRSTSGGGSGGGGGPAVAPAPVPAATRPPSLQGHDKKEQTDETDPPDSPPPDPPEVDCEAQPEHPDCVGEGGGGEGGGGEG